MGEMNRKRSQLQAYFAGVFDGEGCVNLSFTAGPHGSYSLKTTINMDDPQAVAMMAREYPEAQFSYRLRTPKESSAKPYWIFSASHYRGERFLKEILPFSLVKHEQIKVALSFLAHRRRDHARNRIKGRRGNFRRDCGGKCDRYLKLLQDLKRGDKGVNSVNALLEHGLREYRAERSVVEGDVAEMTAKMSSLIEGVENRLMGSTPYKAMSAPEKELFHTSAA